MRKKIILIIVIFIILVSVPISLYYSLKTPVKTPANDICDRVLHQCTDGTNQCGGECTDAETWDCENRECSCGEDNDICGDKCCNKGECFEDAGICCPVDQQCSTDGRNVCCGVDEKCVDNNCVALCGINTCGGGQECLSVDLTTDDEITQFNATDFTYIDTKSIVGKIGYVCMDKNSCSSRDEITAPDAVSNRYPCYKDFFHSDGENTGDVGYCSYKTDSSKIKTCNGGNHTKQTCNSKTDCNWVDVLDSDVERITSDYGLIHSDADTDVYGNCCDDGTGSHYYRVTENDTSNDCNAEDCWSALKNENTLKINWDGVNKRCSTLVKCSQPSSDKNGQFPLCSDNDNLINDNGAKLCENGVLKSKPKPNKCGPGQTYKDGSCQCGPNQFKADDGTCKCNEGWNSSDPTTTPCKPINLINMDGNSDYLKNMISPTYWGLVNDNMYSCNYTLIVPIGVTIQDVSRKMNGGYGGDWYFTTTFPTSSPILFNGDRWSTQLTITTVYLKDDGSPGGETGTYTIGFCATNSTKATLTVFSNYLIRKSYRIAGVKSWQEKTEKGTILYIGPGD